VTSWQDLLAESFVGTDRNLVLDVALSTGAEHLRLRLQSGRLEFVSAAVSGDPDLLIRFRALTLEEVLLGKAETSDVFHDAEVAFGDRWSSPLPAAEADLPRIGHFELIPGASLSVAIHVTSTMFGDVGICERWHDGVLVSSELVGMSEFEKVEKDILMSCSLAQLAAIRRGQLTPLDALVGGVGILGEWPQLMCFAELVQHPAYAPIWEADSTVEAQTAWGAVFCSPAYGDAALKAQHDSVVVVP
jgi:hypothetical protein